MIPNFERNEFALSNAWRAIVAVADVFTFTFDAAT